MKHFLPVLIAGMLFMACNNEASLGSEEKDSVSYSPSEEYAHVRDEMDSAFATEADNIQPYVDKFTPKEVYFEILLREQPAADTLPKDIVRNYSKDEIDYITKKIQPLKPLSNLQLLALYQDVNRGHKVIYGVDDRTPVVYDVNNIERVTDDDNPFMEDGKSVVALIPKVNLTLSRTGNYVLHPRGRFKDVYTLCDTERFLDDPVVAQCSGFAAAADKIVTAGHCINASNFRGFYFVFDFITDSAGRYATRIPAGRVYEATEFLAGDKDETTGRDFAVVRVNKPIIARRIARVNTNTSFSPSMLLHVIGAPCGTPLKLALNANVRSYSNPHYFTVTSDTYGGNSGSPVFNSETHMVEGILVRGEDDFRRISLGPNECSVTVVCPFNGCRGEDVTKNSQYLSHLNR